MHKLHEYLIANGFYARPVPENSEGHACWERDNIIVVWHVTPECEGVYITDGTRSSILLSHGAWQVIDYIRNFTYHAL